MVKLSKTIESVSVALRNKCPLWLLLGNHIVLPGLKPCSLLVKAGGGDKALLPTPSKSLQVPQGKTKRVIADTGDKSKARADGSK